MDNNKNDVYNNPNFYNITPAMFILIKKVRILKRYFSLSSLSLSPKPSIRLNKIHVFSSNRFIYR